MVWPYESLLSYGSCCFPSPIPSRALFSLFCPLDISFSLSVSLSFLVCLFVISSFLRCFGILLHVCCWRLAGFMRSHRTFSSHECDAACLLTDRQCKERSLKKKKSQTEVLGDRIVWNPCDHKVKVAGRRTLYDRVFREASSENVVHKVTTRSEKNLQDFF